MYKTSGDASTNTVPYLTGFIDLTPAKNVYLHCNETSNLNQLTVAGNSSIEKKIPVNVPYLSIINDNEELNEVKNQEATDTIANEVNEEATETIANETNEEATKGTNNEEIKETTEEPTIVKAKTKARSVKVVELVECRQKQRQEALR